MCGGWGYEGLLKDDNDDVATRDDDDEEIVVDYRNRGTGRSLKVFTGARGNTCIPYLLSQFMNYVL